MKIPAWTYSSLDKFETCPRQYYHVKVSKDVVEPPTEHTVWGGKVHEAFEYRIKDGTPLPEGMQQWEGIASKIAALPGEKFCEIKLSIDANFQPSEWSNSWSRGIADLLVVHGSTAAILDYKTGKKKPTEQTMLYAGYVFAHYPTVEVVKTSLVWLKEKKFTNEEFKREEVPVIWKSFLPRVNKVNSAYERDAWPPRPSGLCKAWCHVMSCEFNGKR